MGEIRCYECKVGFGTFCIIHPTWGRPVRVCSDCERKLAIQLATGRTRKKQNAGRRTGTRRGTANRPISATPLD